MKQEQENILPYEALESLGINKKDLKASDTDALLAGRKTDLMNFSVEDTIERRKVLDKEKIDYSAQNGKLDFEGKVQLQKYMTADNTEENKNILKGAKIDFEELQGNKLKFDTNAMRKLAIGVAVLVSPVTALALLLVPKRTEIKNDLGLSDKDIKALKQGEAVGHTNAKSEKILVQLDKDTNNLVSVRSKDISIPNKVAGQEITPIQKEQLRNGQEIQVKDKIGQTVFAKIDLNEKTGLSLKDENGQKITTAPEQKPDITSKQEQDMKKPISDDRIKEIDFQQYDRKIIESLKTEISAVDRFKVDDEAMEVIKRNGLENKFNEADKALQEFREGMPSAENERKLDSVLNLLKREAGLVLDRLDKLDKGIDLKNIKVGDHLIDAKDHEKLTIYNIRNDKEGNPSKFYAENETGKEYNFTNVSLKNQIDNNSLIHMHKSEPITETMKDNYEIQLSTDKDKLQYIATNGFYGVYRHIDSKNTFDQSFMEKYNLLNDYKSAHELNLTVWQGNTPYERRDRLESLNNHGNNMKETATNELTKLDNQEVKQETTSFKMKM
jgi:hypothetical protein